MERNLLIRTLTLPGDANAQGAMFGGWTLAELDKAAGLMAAEIAEGPATTVAIETLSFHKPLPPGADFRIYGRLIGHGRTSMRLELTGEARCAGAQPVVVVSGIFVSVAIDEAGRPRPISVSGSMSEFDG